MHITPHRLGRWGLLLLLTTSFPTVASSASPDAEPSSGLFASSPSLWEAGVGNGFRAGAKEVDISAGWGLGLTVFGTKKHHNWVIGELDFGWVFTDVVAKDHWYRGNWELLAEIFGGEQLHPGTAYLIGGGPHFRYNFATGTRWVPFFDFGGGVTATDIRNGELSTTFEFNLQAGAGVHYFIKDNLSLTFQWRYIHLSNADLKQPNVGVNNSSFLFGASWFF